MADENPSIMNHVFISVSDFEQARSFYDAVLGVIGAKRILEHPGAVAYGKLFPEFWVHSPPFDGGRVEAANGVHFAFTADSRAQVDAFYRAAIAAGAVDDGKPGPRPDYGEPAGR